MKVLSVKKKDILFQDLCDEQNGVTARLNAKVVTVAFVKKIYTISNTQKLLKDQTTTRLIAIKRLSEQFSNIPEVGEESVSWPFQQC